MVYSPITCARKKPSWPPWPGWPKKLNRRFTEFPLDLDHPHPARRWKLGWLWDLQKLEHVGKTIGKSTEDPNEFDEKSIEIISNHHDLYWMARNWGRFVLRQSLCRKHQGIARDRQICLWSYTALYRFLEWDTFQVFWQCRVYCQ